MALLDSGPSSAIGAERLHQVAELLGGRKVFRAPIESSLEAHEAIAQGLPGAALEHLLSNVVVLKGADVLQSAVGVSSRTVQRRKDSPTKPLSQDQGGRAWKFADILTRAREVLGSQEEAEAWLARPALALEGRRPLDLLSTPAGTELVDDLLGRMEYGVYT